MTAKLLNMHVRIISRMIDQSLEPKLKKTWGNQVVSPNYIGELPITPEMF
jgi:voltage-gated potassium channel